MPAVLPLALAAIGLVVAALALLTVGRRAVRRSRSRTRQALAEPLRPLLLQLVAGEPDEATSAAARLIGLPPAAWRAVEPDLEALLLKVRGETHGALVDVLDRRGTLATALERTRHRDPVVRARGAEVLGAARRRSAVTDLVRLLDDHEPEVRQVASRALGRIGSPQAAAPLLAVVGGERDVPPRLVSTALLRIGAAAHPALVGALEDGEALRRAVAAEIAGLDGAVSAVPALLGRLRSDDVLDVRVRCAQALGRIGMPAAVDALLAASDDDEPAVLRAAAARALGDLGSPAAVARLATLLGDPVHRVAANAAAGLVTCGPFGLTILVTAAAEADGEHAREALASARLRGVLPPAPAAGVAAS